MTKKIHKFIYIHYSELDSLQKSLYYFAVYSFLSHLVIEYPQFREWYQKLFTSDFELRPDREIIICSYQSGFAGVTILKKTAEEQKICTLRVARKYQKQGIAKNLMKLGIEWLEDERPLVTLHKSKEREFKALFDYFDFKLEQKCRGYYNLFGSELVYNGNLPQRETWHGQLIDNNLRIIINHYVKNGILGTEEMMKELYYQCLKQERYRYKFIFTS